MSGTYSNAPCIEEGYTTSQTWKAMESNRFPHVFRKKKGSYF
jgi:hypothetical protein